MAEKIIKVASFPYAGPGGVERTALRGDKVAITDESDLERGERLGVFATDADLKSGTVFGDFYSELLQRQQVTEPEPTRTPGQDPDPGPKPSGKDSREKWAEYARTKDAPEAELVPVEQGGLTRDQLREKYGA